MRKDIEGEAALALLADLLEPAQVIFSDDEIVQTIKKENSKIKWVQAMLRKQPKAVIKMMAILDGEDPETFKVNVFTLPAKILELLNDPDVSNLFTSQGQPKKESASSGSAQENTEAQ